MLVKRKTHGFWNRAVLLDVSMEDCPKTIEGSVRIALYQPITGWSIPQIARRAGFAAFGVDGTGAQYTCNQFGSVRKKLQLKKKIDLGAWIISYKGIPVRIHCINE